MDPKKPTGLEYVQYILDLEKLFAGKIDLVTYKGLSQDEFTNNAPIRLASVKELEITGEASRHISKTIVQTSSGRE